MAPTTLTAIVLMVALGTHITLGAESAQTGWHAVRTEEAEIAHLVRLGVSTSATFRALIERIEATDGMVFVTTGRCGHGVRACLKLSLTLAGPHRLLHITIDPKKAPWDAIGSLGHELWHALEVLDDPSIVSYSRMYDLYTRIGIKGWGRFETNAATQAGGVIRREAREALRGAASHNSEKTAAPGRGDARNR